MKSKVEQYAKGDFYTEYPKVVFSKNYLQLKIEAGSVYSGSIDVLSDNKIPMKMMVYDDAYFLRLANHSLVGQNAQINFTFDATNKVRGSVYEGTIYVIGSGLEKKISYSIEIVAPFLDQNGTALEELMKFSALAESDWDRALTIFYSDEFADTMLAHKAEYATIYRSLMNSPDPNMALEEFLVYIHKKRALLVQVDYDHFQFHYPNMKEEHEFKIRKNTWGYCNIKIHSDAKFIVIPQKEFSSMDFDGDCGTIRYILDPDLMEGHNLNEGCIWLEGPQQTMCVQIVVKKTEEANDRILYRKKKEHLKKVQIATLTHTYLKYRIGVYSLEEFVEKTTESLRQLLAYEPDTDLYKLGILHMDMLAGKEDVVLEEFCRMEADMNMGRQGVKVYCYYLYLKAFLYGKPDMVKEACEAIEDALAVEKDKLFYFWLLIYLDPHYQRDKQWMYSQIEGLVIGGYCSPILYVEICDLFNSQPMLLRRITPIELEAMRYGMKNHYLSEDVKDQFLQVVSKEKEFRVSVFRVLKMLYEESPKPLVIKNMCALLLKGGRIDQTYCAYYLEGIKCGYKLVGIQEHYLYSMDKSRYDLIPDSVLRYFKYKTSLSEQDTAYLYANVITNKKQYLALYDEYLPNIEAFMIEQIKKGAISDDLAVLYSELLKPEMVQASYAGSLSKVIFKRKLTVNNDSIIAVVVSHKELAKEMTYPVIHHVAFVDMVTESAVISLVDKEHNRFVSTMPYKLEKLVNETDYMGLLAQYAADDYRYVLYQYDLCGACDAKEAREVNVARHLLELREVSEQTKQQALLSIIRYYHKNLDIDILSSYLNRLQLEYVDPRISGELIQYLLECEYYEKAYEAIKKFGFLEVESSGLVRMVERLKGYSQFASEEELTAVAVSLYRRGRETASILSYLIDSYQSGLKDMIGLWKRANGMVQRLELLEENIICQTLYTEQWEKGIFPIFLTYYNKKRHGLVIKAFFKRACFAYLVEDVEVPEAFFDMLHRHMEMEGVYDDVMYAAQLLFYSRKVKLEPDEIAFVKTRLNYFKKRGIVLPYFRSFKRYVSLPKDLFLMTYVITKDRAGKNITFRYGIQTGVEKPELSKRARMMELLPGYYAKEFVLFHGENLLYEMNPEHSDHTQVYESEGMKTKGEMEAYENRFEMIQSMLVSQEAGDNEVLNDKIDKYLKLAAVIEENLDIIE